MALISILRNDLSRIAMPTWRNAFKCYFLPRGECFPYVVWLRILQAVRKRPLLKYLLGPLVYWRYRHFEFKYGIHANANTEIGDGFRPVHGPCNLNARRIGRNFTVYPGVTIGVNRDGVPTIEDNVTIYTNAVVCGSIILQAGVVVRALSYVDKDMAPAI